MDNKSYQLVHSTIVLELQDSGCHYLISNVELKMSDFPADHGVYFKFYRIFDVPN